MEAGDLRALCKSSMESCLFGSSVFYAEQLVKVEDSADSVMLLARSLFMNGEGSRAFHVLQERGLVRNGVASEALYLGSLALISEERYEEAHQVLEGGEEQAAGAGEAEEAEASLERLPIALASRLAYLKGQVQEAQENRGMATSWFMEAVKCDPRCYQAFEALTSRHMLSAQQEEELAHGIREKARAHPQVQWLWAKYAQFLDKYTAKNVDGAEEPEAAVQSLYYQNRWEECFSITKRLEFLSGGLQLAHIGAMVALGRKNDLFYYAHRLVDEHPELAVSWYAVGCYYYTVRRYDQARPYFRRAATLDKDYGEAWLGYAHAFAAQGESDQSMAAYRVAARLLSGCHIPALCIGMEYIRVNNLSLALKFVSTAQEMCPSDPLVINELGVVRYKERRWEEALSAFEAVRELVGPSFYTNAAWEPTASNMGHVLRKLERYQEAVDAFRKALALRQGPTTLTAIGFTYHMEGQDLDQAINYYHQALALKPDDAFTNDLLKRALEDF